jgi:hypothetical protein
LAPFYSSFTKIVNQFIYWKECSRNLGGDNSNF